MMKKRISLFLAVWFVLFTCLSCGESQAERENETASQAQTPVGASSETVGEGGDSTTKGLRQSWNRGHGLAKCRSRHIGRATG